jgi:two-component system KDP operon response regulator KdpE
VTPRVLLLVIEDEAGIRDFLRTELGAAGFASEEAATGAQGLTLTESLQPDLVLLDLGLPDLDGLVVLARLRQRSNLPVIILSARGTERDKVKALEAGADDYLTKPFGAAELLARVHAVLRRAAPALATVDQSVTVGPVVWDRSAHSVTLDGERMHLTPTEYRLFAALALQAGRVVTHHALLQEVWGRRSNEMLHYVRIGIAGLRKKLEPRPDSAQVLHTEVGVGYRLEAR